ncbi:MAG: hypothetical protein IPP09_08965 [Elusimicrobia bacterium]|nr:hypothetical protein [Elusimicrobiota bacterium]
MRLLARILVVVMALNGGALRAAPAATKDGAKPAAAKNRAHQRRSRCRSPDQPAPRRGCPPLASHENLGPTR